MHILMKFILFLIFTATITAMEQQSHSAQQLVAVYLKDKDGQITHSDIVSQGSVDQSEFLIHMQKFNKQHGKGNHIELSQTTSDQWKLVKSYLGLKSGTQLFSLANQARAEMKFIKKSSIDDYKELAHNADIFIIKDSLLLTGAQYEQTRKYHRR